MFLRRFKAVVLEPFLFIPHTAVLKSNSSQAVQKDVGQKPTVRKLYDLLAKLF